MTWLERHYKHFVRVNYRKLFTGVLRDRQWKLCNGVNILYGAEEE